MEHVLCASWASSHREVINSLVCASGSRGGDAGGCGCEEVGLCVRGLLWGVWGALQSRNGVPPTGDTGLRGHGAQVLGACCQRGQVIGGKVPASSPARAHPSTDRLGVAGAAQDAGRGALSPGEQVGDVGVKVAGPRVVAQSDDSK